MKFGQSIMAAVIIQIQGIKDVSEIHKTNGVELSFFQHYNYRNIENHKQKYCLNQLCIMQFVKKNNNSFTPIEQSCTLFIRYTCTYSIMEASFVSRTWSVRIQGMDISMGNYNHQIVRSKA